MKRVEKSRLPRHTVHESGQAAVEFALVILFVIFLFLGMLEMIFLMYAYNTLADSAKEGVRYAVVHGTGSSTINGGLGCSGPGTSAITCPDPNGANVQSRALTFAALSMQSVSAANVNVDYNPGGVNGARCNTPGCMVRVTVSKAYRPFFGLGWPSVTINAAANGRIMN